VHVLKVFYEQINEWCVYVQGVTATTRRQRITSREKSSDECDSLQCEQARFGFALTNIGDLDRDGYTGQYWASAEPCII